MQLSKDPQLLSLLNCFLITPEGMKEVGDVLGKVSAMEKENKILKKALELAADLAADQTATEWQTLQEHVHYWITEAEAFYADS